MYICIYIYIDIFMPMYIAEVEAKVHKILLSLEVYLQSLSLTRKNSGVSGPDYLSSVLKVLP
jgi:hypothetical protein